MQVRFAFSFVHPHRQLAQPRFGVPVDLPGIVAGAVRPVVGDFKPVAARACVPQTRGRRRCVRGRCAERQPVESAPGDPSTVAAVRSARASRTNEFVVRPSGGIRDPSHAGN